MNRLHLFEIEDQDWCPRALRDTVTDYLEFITRTTKPFAAMVPILADSLRRGGSRHVLDLGSGAGGPWLWLHPVLTEMGLNLTVCLTDKYPNQVAMDYWQRISHQAVSYSLQPVDATRVPAEVIGFRTMFTSFHHFRPAEAREVLADAAMCRQGIGVFEVTGRRLLPFIMVLLLPLLALILTPFIRPFRWSRLFWTYLVPVGPFIAVFDGLVSLMRTYNTRELRELIKGLEIKDYEWDIGVARGKRTQPPVTYLIGIPKQT
jgi:hypothetical protein